MELSMLSIEAAEELQRRKLNLSTNFKNTRQLTKLIEKKFNTRFDYKLTFTEAYRITYNGKSYEIHNKQERYRNSILKQLKSPTFQSNKKLEKLIEFCTNLSDYAASHEEELEKMKKEPCFQ